MKTALAILLAITGLSTAALAQDHPPFEEVDKNSDGRIDRAEAEMLEGIDFAAVDTNDDGAIDREEYGNMS